MPVYGDYGNPGADSHDWANSVGHAAKPKSEAELVVDFMTSKVNGLGIPNQQLIDAMQYLVDTSVQRGDSAEELRSAINDLFKLAAKDTPLARLHGEATETTRSVLAELPRILGDVKAFFSKKSNLQSQGQSMHAHNIDTVLAEIERAYAETIGKSRGAVASVA